VLYLLAPWAIEDEGAEAEEHTAEDEVTSGYMMNDEDTRAEDDIKLLQ